MATMYASSTSTILLRLQEVTFCITYKLYIYNLAKIARSNLLYYLQRAVLPSDTAIMQKGDPDMWKDVLNAEYPLS